MQVTLDYLNLQIKINDKLFKQYCEYKENELSILDYQILNHLKLQL
jgi:hypothetical protein